MRKRGWIGLGVVVLVVLLGILVACGGTTQGATPDAGGTQAVTPTKEVAPTATVGAGETKAATPTQEVAPTATVSAGETKAATPTQEVVPTATMTAGETKAATPTKEVVPTATSSPGGTETPAALDGKALIQERCTKCHDLTRIQQAKKTRDQWEATVRRMIEHGAQLTQVEQDAAIAYLTKTYPQ